MSFERFRQREQEQNPQLVGAQLPYLIDGITPEDRRQSDLNSTIRRKITLIPQRLKWLSEDLAVLRAAESTHPDLETETAWSTAVDELETLHTENIVYDDGKIKGGYKGGDPEFYARVGVQVGHLAKLLLTPSLSAASLLESENEFYKSAARTGLILGFDGNFFNNPYKYLDPSTYDRPSHDRRGIEMFHVSPSLELGALKEMAEEELDYGVSYPYDRERALSDAGFPDLDLFIDVVEEFSEDPIVSVKQFVDASQRFKDEQGHLIEHAQEMADNIIEEIQHVNEYQYRGKESGASAAEVLCAKWKTKRDPDNSNSSASTIINNWRPHDAEHTSNQPCNVVKNAMCGKKGHSERWEQYPLMNDDGTPTAYGKLIGKIIFQNSKVRNTNKYLPTRIDPEQKIIQPTSLEIQIASYAFALGQPSTDQEPSPRKNLFKKAFTEIIEDE